MHVGPVINFYTKDGVRVQHIALYFSDITYANKLETDISLINNPSGNDSIQISSKDEFVEATVPDGAYFVKFTSFNSVNKEITLEVTPVVSIKNTLEPEIIDKDDLN